MCGQFSQYSQYLDNMYVHVLSRTFLISWWSLVAPPGVGVFQLIIGCLGSSGREAMATSKMSHLHINNMVSVMSLLMPCK